MLEFSGKLLLHLEVGLNGAPDAQELTLAHQCDKELPQRVIRKLNLFNQKAWRQTIRVDVHEVSVALLMLVYPHLRKLDILVSENTVISRKVLEHSTVIRPEAPRMMSM